MVRRSLLLSDVKKTTSKACLNGNNHHQDAPEFRRFFPINSWRLLSFTWFPMKCMIGRVYQRKHYV